MPGKLSEIKGIVFDLDGTLLDTLEDLALAGNHVLAANMLPERPKDDYRYFVGQGMRKLIRHATGLDACPGVDIPHPDRALSDAGVDAMLTQFRDYYGRHWAVKTRPYPGIVSMLGELSAKGLPFCVLSNKDHDLTVEIIRYYFPEIRFVAVEGKTESRRAKPDPEAALALAGKMGSAPGQTAMVGDTSTDMQTAANSGFYPVGVAWGFRPREELLKFGAASLLERPTDLFSLL